MSVIDSFVSKAVATRGPSPKLSRYLSSPSGTPVKSTLDLQFDLGPYSHSGNVHLEGPVPTHTPKVLSLFSFHWGVKTGLGDPFVFPTKDSFVPDTLSGRSPFLRFQGKTSGL